MCSMFLLLLLLIVKDPVNSNFKDKHRAPHDPHLLAMETSVWVSPLFSALLAAQTNQLTGIRPTLVTKGWTVLVQKEPKKGAVVTT